MKYSLASLHNSAQFYNGHLWTLSFNDSTPNIQKSGGSIGDVIPAQTVTEPIYELEYEQVTVGNGLTLPIFKKISYLGDLTFDFFDSGKKDELLKIRQFFTDWSRTVQKDNLFFGMKDAVKTVEVSKYSRNSGSFVLQSVYDVLPPDRLQFQGQSSPEFITDSVTLHIVRVHKKNE